eukprot:g31485.t1
MRNGDYPPSRWEVQKETVNALVRAKLDSNQEATVGVLSMAGRRTEVHVSPQRSTGEINKVMTKDVIIGGTSNIMTAVKTAQLVLKNRQNKNLKQRVVVFVGSPVEEDVKGFQELGDRLHKLGISVDVINFGSENESNNEKLQALVNRTNGEGENPRDTSHFLYAPSGATEFIDRVMASAIGGQSSHGGGGAMGAGDPSFGAAGAGSTEEDEIAMAMRMSMEEEFHRMAAQAGTAAPATTTTTAQTPIASSAAPMQDDDEEDDEEEMDDELQAALALSMKINNEGFVDNEEAQATSAGTTTTTAPKAAATEAPKEEELDGEDVEDILRDEAFLQQLISESGGSDMTLDALLEGEQDDDDPEDSPSKKKQKK